MWAGPTSAVLVGQEQSEKVETIKQGDCVEAVPAVSPAMWQALLCCGRTADVVHAAQRGPVEEAVQHWEAQGGGAVQWLGRTCWVRSDVRTCRRWRTAWQ